MKASDLNRPENTPQARENRSVNTDAPHQTGKPSQAQGEPADGGEPQSAALPRMPHERDESSGMTGGQPDAKVQQAARDLKRGLQDTGRLPVTDSTYERLKK